MSQHTQQSEASWAQLRSGVARIRGLALAACVLTLSCGGPQPNDGSAEGVDFRQFGLTLTLSSSVTYALASGAMPSNTVSGGTAPYTCAITTNRSGGASCSVSGTTVSYTAGSNAYYSMRSWRTSDYLQLVTATGGPYVETGAATLAAAEYFKMAASGTGFTFQAKSNSNYVRNAGTISTGNNLVADVTAGSAGVYAMTNCNGTGNPGAYNRFGFQSATGTNPYWKAQSPTVDAVNNGNGSACSPTNSSPWEGFDLSPATDVLTITDAASNTGTITVSVENPIAFTPSSTTVNYSTAIPTVQTWGGNGIFTGGSAGCSVTTNNSGGGSCTVTGSGVVSYTTGPSSGTDTLRITDSQGHTGTFNVTVLGPFALSASTSYALASGALGTSVSVSGGSQPYSCSVTTSTSGGSSCSVSGGVVSYTAGATAGFNIKAQKTTDYLRLVTASTVPYVQTGGAVGSSAELWKVFPFGPGYIFQANSSGNYLRAGGTVSAGNDLVADVAVAFADPFTLQNCNGSGNPGSYNRFGFKSASGTSPYWKAQAPNVDAVNNGNGSACNTADSTAWEAFYLVPTVDVLRISDSASQSSSITVSIEQPITFASSALSVASSTAVTNQALGGSGAFTGGSSACTVSTNNTGGGACTTTGYGLVSYTPGASAGTDTITLTDSQGHTGSFTVSVGYALTQVGVGPNYFNCGRVNNGSARCWGINSNGELGSGSTSTYSSTLLTVSGLTTVASVVAGENHACALLSDGTIKCWGQGTYGQLGNGSLNSSSTPVTVTGISTATAISAGMLHTCALLSGGTVSCWGYNASRQLGNSVGAFPTASAPVTVTGLSSVNKVSAGGFHNCALTSAGAVKCWGDNSSGQLGNGSSTNSFSPVAVTGLSSGVSDISAGELHACAVISGAVKCWGDNTYGQLGTGNTTTSSTPVSVAGLSTASTVAAAFPFTCALITDQTVKCWGRNTEGEIGDTSSTDRLSPTTVTGVNTVSSLSASGLNACAVLSSGLTTCWGYNGSGQIGNGNTTDAHTPTGVVMGCTSCGLPDVTISALSWSPTTLTAGSSYTFSATVFNQGVASSPAGTIMGIRFDIDGTQVNFASLYTTAIAPGASVTITSNSSTWTATSGAHTLLGWVDDVNRFAETNKTNNKLTTSLTVP